jgi:uncharacterized protein
MLSVTGGIPKYLEEINPRLSAEDNIKRLCFTHGGFLVEEFEQLFSDVFLRDSEFYKKIAETLCSGRRTIGEIESRSAAIRVGKIARHSYALKSLASLPEWSTIMGLQFENLVLNSRTQLHQLMRVNPEEIVNDNPFYQRQTVRQAGCQIDYSCQRCKPRRRRQRLFRCHHRCE